MTCWPEEHNAAGFELAVNGADTYASPDHRHSVYVHVRRDDRELAQKLAAAVGGRIMSEPAVGW
jgi:hypothetical protein